MKSIDPKAEQQVWQRVAAPPVPRKNTAELSALIQSAAEVLALYRSLIPLLSGPSREEAQGLASAQQGTLSALRGILRLSGGKPKPGSLPDRPIRNLEGTLEQCYHRTRQAAAAYTALSLSPEFGPVFRQLADREERNAAAIARILGQSGR